MTVSHDYDYPSYGEDREFKFNRKSKPMKEGELDYPNMPTISLEELFASDTRKIDINQPSGSKDNFSEMYDNKTMKEEELSRPNKQFPYGEEFMINHKNDLNEFFGVDTIVDSWSQEQIDAVNNVNHKKIRRFPSGAVRSDDTGRIRPDYLSPYAIAEIAEHFTTAKNDFGPTNYFLGIKPEEVVPSVMRHMLEIQEGLITGDKAMVRNGFRSLGANSIMALHQIVLEEKGLYKEKYNSTELVNADEYLKTLEDGKTN